MSRSNSDRTLVKLEKSGSTARVLNLLSVHRRQTANPSLELKPMFQNSSLNHAIVLKHRLRPHEQELFAEARSTATKIIVPIDRTDLRAGGQSFFVGEHGFEHIMETYFHDKLGTASDDFRLLLLLDTIPSMDPFLLRENLNREGYNPAIEYFNISEADLMRMRDFVSHEMSGLARLVGCNEGKSARDFTQKLLAINTDSALAPLRDALKMDQKNYSDGIFAWRGMLYYKWIVGGTLDDITTSVSEICNLVLAPPRSSDNSEYIREARKRISLLVSTTTGSIVRDLKEYDKFYSAFISEDKPAEFRDFLMSAPSKFFRMGEMIGALQHIVSFWNYRTGSLSRGRVSEADFVDMLVDFESSLVFDSGVQINEPAHRFETAAA